MLILGNKNKYCLFFGLIVLALGFIFYPLHKKQQADELVSEIDKEVKHFEVTNEEQLAVLNEYKQAKKTILKKKHRTMVLFFVVSIALVVVAIASLI